MTSPDVPHGEDDITSSWLQAALRPGIDEVEVGEVHVNRITADVGLVGQVYRITPRYDRAPDDAPTSLILKIPTDDPMIFGFASGMGMYERECRFYAHIAPDIAIPVPRVLFNVCRPDDGAYCLLMEEIPIGATVRQTDGATPEQAREVIAAIADVHAAWFDHPSLEQWSWLPTPGSPANKSVSPRFEGAWPTFQDQFAAGVPSEAVAWVETFAPKMDAWLDSHDEDTHTVVHGDFRLDNMLWDTDGRFVLLDWQVVQAGTGMYDVAYFLATNMDIEARRATEHELLDLWRTVLTTAGVEIGSREDVWRQYQEVVLYLTTAVTCAVGDFGGSEDGRAVLDMLISRAFTAAADIDAGAVMP